MKYIFITIIYLFIFSVIRLIYLDIRSTNSRKEAAEKAVPYLKLINMRESLDFRVSETYFLGRNVRIGRRLSNEICIQDPYLSGSHAEIIMQDGKYSLKDAGSTNGTFINGIPTNKEEAPLKDGDRIRVGQVEFLFVGSGL